MREDPLEVLGEFFGVDQEVAETILMLTHWVDQELAVEKYGYPKDNVIPPPIRQRLTNEKYLDKMIEVAEDQEPELVDILRRAR